MTVTQSLHPWRRSSPMSGRMWTATLTQQSSPASIRSSQRKSRKERIMGKEFPEERRRRRDAGSVDYVRQSLAVKDQFFLENRSHCLKMVEEGRIRK